MPLTSPAGPINPEGAENYEEIEKQFAVKGEYNERGTFLESRLTK